MKGPETFRSLSERNLLYLYEGPRDLQKPLGKEFVIPIGRAQRPAEASRKGICYTYMKGLETFRSLSERNLKGICYTYMKGPETRAQRPSEASRKGICYTYMKGPDTFRSLSERNLLYLYEGPRDLQKPLGKEFVIPI